MTGLKVSQYIISKDPIYTFTKESSGREFTVILSALLVPTKIQ